MQKRQKKWLILSLKIVITLIGLVLTIVHFLPGNDFYKIWGYVITLGIAWAPDIFKMIGIKISRQLELAYLIFLIPSMILGIDFDWYKSMIMFDKIVHLASGGLAAFAANEILRATYGKLGGKNLAFKLLMMVSFVAFTAVMWECFEFLHDIIFDGHMQELISTGLDDTMWDMIWALGGGFVVSLALLFAPWDAPRVR